MPAMKRTASPCCREKKGQHQTFVAHSTEKYFSIPGYQPDEQPG